jgi:hypothetical protein
MRLIHINSRPWPWPAPEGAPVCWGVLSHVFQYFCLGQKGLRTSLAFDFDDFSTFPWSPIQKVCTLKHARTFKVEWDSKSISVAFKGVNVSPWMPHRRSR